MRHSGRRGGSSYRPGESGTHWLSFSDMMSALVLVFILVMFYSVYQYLDMLEIKTAELIRQSGLLDQKQQELSVKDEELTKKDEELTQKDEALRTSEGKLSENEKALVQQQATLLLKQQELDESNSLLERQRQELDAARSALEEQNLQLDRAQALLSAQQASNDEKEALLVSQQKQMSDQQDKLDQLVGVRSRIIETLAQALSDNNIRASVDPRTGSITLAASVLFDSGKSELKDSGKAVLDGFLPVYLSVLMDAEYSDNISEIIIEGHTDTDGSYMMNLKLSQERALSVMEYILADEYRGITGGMKNRLRRIATANGRSYSNPVNGADGSIDKDASRRVEFKFRLQDEQMIDSMRQILDAMG